MREGRCLYERCCRFVRYNIWENTLIPPSNLVAETLIFRITCLYRPGARLVHRKSGRTGETRNRRGLISGIVEVCGAARMWQGIKRTRPQCAHSRSSRILSRTSVAPVVPRSALRIIRGIARVYTAYSFIEKCGAVGIHLATIAVRLLNGVAWRRDADDGL